jgi:endonuclease/exonuclease/phosphatase family metal-dependent hydrolase
MPPALQRTVRVLFAAALLAGCGPPVSVKVMTRNLFLGTDLFGLSQLTSLDQVPPAVAALWVDVQASDFPSRAGKVADEVVAQDPDVIGLQEVELYRIQAVSDFASNPSPNATTVVLDFEQVLLDALAARGASYQVAQETVNTDAELPMDVEGGQSDLRLTDRDVILVRQDLATSSVTSHNYSSKVPLSIGGATGVQGSLVRGLGSVKVTLKEHTFTVANSHLEVDTGLLGSFQEAQGRELVNQLSSVKGPLIVLGDFNSPADGSSTSTYYDLTQKFTDTWPKVHSEPGLTCCTLITSPTYDATVRIDLVLFRDDVRAKDANIVGSDAASDKTAQGLWPSDHGGVVATLEVGG